MLLLFQALAFVLAMAATSTVADARSHVALVIDNSVAPGGRSAQARDIAGALERMSYTVRVTEGADAGGLRKLLSTFAGETRAADVALFYYRGPALSAGGANHIVAANAGPRASLADAGVALAEIEAAMGASKANVLLLDPAGESAVAPLISQGTDRSLALSAFAHRPGFLIASAAAPGQGRMDQPGVFSEALVHELAHRDFSWAKLAQNLRWQTFQRSRGALVPMIVSGLDGSVRVAALGNDAAPLPPVAAPALTPAQRRALIIQVQKELNARNCHHDDADGDAENAARGLAELRRARGDAPRLDVASATSSEYEAWLEWLRSTKGRLCAPPEPPARTKKPVAKQPREERPARAERQERRERPVQRRVEREDPPRRSAPSRRESGGGEGGGNRSGGGGSIRVPSF